MKTSINKLPNDPLEGISIKQLGIKLRENLISCKTTEQCQRRISPR